MSHNGHSATPSVTALHWDMESLASDSDLNIEMLMSRIRQRVNGAAASAPPSTTTAPASLAPFIEAVQGQAEFNQRLMQALQMIAERLTRLERQQQALLAESAHQTLAIEQIHARLNEHLEQSEQETEDSAIEINDEVARTEHLAHLSDQISQLFAGIDQLDQQAATVGSQLFALDRIVRRESNRKRVRKP